MKLALSSECVSLPILMGDKQHGLLPMFQCPQASLPKHDCLIDCLHG